MKNSTQTKAEQLKNILLEKIRSGEYPVGSKLPSMRVLVKTYSMCKFTVAQVLNNMSEKGYILQENRRAAKVLKCPARYKIGLFYLSSEIQYKSFWGEFYRGIHDEVKTHSDFEIIDIIDTDFARRFDPAGLDGTLVMGSPGTRAVTANGVVAEDHPMVYVYNCPTDKKYCGVTSDFSEAMLQYISLMHSQGCRKIIYVNRMQNNNVTENKLKWLKHAAEMNNTAIEIMDFAPDDLIKENIYSKFLSLFSAENSIDGVILTSDKFAGPVFRAAYECGKNIPQDIKVASIDNLSDGAYMIPTLTTLELDRYAQGKAAAQMLIGKILEPDSVYGPRFFPAHPIFRESLTVQ